MTDSKTQISVRLDDKDLKLLDDMAGKLKLSRSAMASTLISLQLNQIIKDNVIRIIEEVDPDA
jgi:hypothetical protein